MQQYISRFDIPLLILVQLVEIPLNRKQALRTAFEKDRTNKLEICSLWNIQSHSEARHLIASHYFILTILQRSIVFDRSTLELWLLRGYRQPPPKKPSQIVIPSEEGTTGVNDARVEASDTQGEAVPLENIARMEPLIQAPISIQNSDISCVRAETPLSESGAHEGFRSGSRQIGPNEIWADEEDIIGPPCRGTHAPRG